MKSIHQTGSVQQIFHLLSIRGKYQVIGSANLPEIRYASDYDLQEFVTESTIDHYPTILLKIFQQKFDIAKKNPKIFITDFKCGMTNSGEPIRWTYKDIQRGKQRVDGKWLSFEECVLMKATMKMDIIALIHGIFTEFSENYYIELGKWRNYIPTTKAELLESLKHDAYAYYHEGKKFKALKRIFSYFHLRKGNEPEEKKLKALFNSPVGFLNKAKNELDILQTVLDNPFRCPLKKDILRNLHIVQHDINYPLSPPSSDTTKEIQVLKSSLENKINKATQSFLDNNLIIYQYIK
jgi:hypothetical protein